MLIFPKKNNDTIILNFVNPTFYVRKTKRKKQRVEKYILSLSIFNCHVFLLESNYKNFN